MFGINTYALLVAPWVLARCLRQCYNASTQCAQEKTYPGAPLLSAVSRESILSILHTLIAPFAKAGLTFLSRRRHPLIHGTLALEGLLHSTEIIRDRWGIPHIYAQNLHDLFFAQGFVHAQDRLWQMELNRRVAQGRLSEIFGEVTLETDRISRVLGFNRLGIDDWQGLSGELREILLAYSQGVNAFIESPSSKLPLEFTLLKHRPEPWTPEDSSSYARVLNWQLSHAWSSEIARAEIAEEVGEEHAAELEINYTAGHPLAMPHGIEFNLLDADGTLRKSKGPFLERSMGSNAWAVSGEKTSTGKPFLCNDPHLKLSLPSLWYATHLIGAGFNVTGASLPGLPLVIVGHNTQIAWGMALAFTDCEDLFVERMSPQDPARYQFKNKWRKAEVVRETIEVKNQAAHLEEVIITHHGPIISEVIGDGKQSLALNSMALRPGSAFLGWLLLNQAQHWDDFVEAMRLIEAPQLAITYADVGGNIGFWVTGKVPIREKGDGSVPAPGWTGEYEWIGEVPFEEMPHSFNPQGGHIVACNNRLVPDDYPHFLGNVWVNGYRAQRIEDLLSEHVKLTADDFRRIQNDRTSLAGLELMEQLQGLESENADVQLALERLRDWDGELTVDSVGGALYEVLRTTLVHNLLESGLSAELLEKSLGKGFHPLYAPTNEFYGHDTGMLLRTLQNPGSWWLMQAGGREALLTRSIRQTVEWLRETLGSNPDRWKWGKIHRLTFGHSLGMRKPLDRVFNRGPYAMGGDTDTPNQMAMLPHEPYAAKAAGPSYRQIIDLGDFSRSMAILPPGQSGHLGNRHYDDLVKPWLKGEYVPMLWTREQVIENAEGRLLLRRR